MSNDVQEYSHLPVNGQVQIDLTWIPGKIEHRVMFGRSVSERATDSHRRTATFAQGMIFAVMRWASSDLGLTVVRLEILRAAKPGSVATRIPFVRPAVDILLRVSGWADVQRVVHIIDAIKAAGIDPADAAPDYWQHVGNRLAAGERPSPYTRTRHLAWRLRRRIAP
jgi:hypothetical protein